MIKLIVTAVLLLLGSCSARGTENVAKVSDDSNAGADYNNSNTKTEYSQLDKARLVAQTLLDHDDVFRQLEAIGRAFFTFQSSLPKGNKDIGSLVGQIVLSRLPSLFKSAEFQRIMQIVADEVNKVNVSEFRQLVEKNNWAPNSTEATSALLDIYDRGINFERMMRRIVSRSNGTDDQCPFANVCSALDSVNPETTVQALLQILATDGGNSNQTSKGFDIEVYQLLMKNVKVIRRLRKDGTL